MTVISLRYHFRQPFRVPAPVAYTWCTDFGPDDGALFSERTQRSVRRVSEDALVMTDATYPAGRPVRIRRLVRLFPEERAWTNTHLDGPYEGSQVPGIGSCRTGPGGPTSSSMASGSNDIPAPSPRRRPPSGPTGADATTRENGDVVSPRPSSGSARSRSPGNPRRGFLLPPAGAGVHRGLEIGLHLKPGLPDENFVAEAIGNLAAFRLQTKRGETLAWQVIRVELPNSHHFRLVIRHPDRVLDVGIEHDVKTLLDALSDETVEELRNRFEAARREGLTPVRLRHLRESVDYWRDDFWNWLG